MRIALLALLGLISCAAPESDVQGQQAAVALSDSALYYFGRIDSGIATSEELEFAKKHALIGMEGMCAVGLCFTCSRPLSGIAPIFSDIIY